MRLDQYLNENGYTKSRDRAKDLIKTAKVKVNGKIIKKPSLDIAEADIVELLVQDHPYVSRSALKLQTLLKASALRLKDKVVIDVGSSTGGFTQMALEHNAASIYAVDVGTDQLDASLKEDSRVISLEKTDARDLKSADFEQLPQVMLADVSFISVTQIIPAVVAEFPSIEELAILVKPQFELQPQDIGAGGIVKSKKLQQQAVQRVKDCISDNGFKVKCQADAPVSGNRNQEFLLYAVKA